MIGVFDRKSRKKIEFIFGSGQEKYGKDPIITGKLAARKALLDIESKINGKIDKKLISLAIISCSKMTNNEKYNLWGLIKGVKDETEVSLSQIVTTTDCEIIGGMIDDNSIACVMLYSNKLSIRVGLARIFELDMPFYQWLYRWFTKGFKVFK